jgi:hypothetical protein
MGSCSALSIKAASELSVLMYALANLQGMDD